MRKRTHQIKIWMNDEEYNLLLDKMQRSGQTRQNVMISALKEATITTEEEISELMRNNSLIADLQKTASGYGDKYQSDGTYCECNWTNCQH